ncbi:hypothetical protein C9J01_10845 [Photobacterium rosenbergii]|uniref:Uncharacterized protein n=1 Tax=Photobacterium rosenbergii TaxID=294936 RepID=A0A2T3NFJ9_9GAMM|nr:hypothetical protein [Photobacterium rosenbergii]PSW13337.1 hypothetical protein C9J01_10845 [Photobacterium rosenbergii]
MNEQGNNPYVIERRKRITRLLWGVIVILTMTLITVTYISVIINPPRFENFPYRVLNSEDASKGSDKSDTSKKIGSSSSKEKQNESPSKNDHLVQYIAYLTYEKIISWVGIIGGIFFIVGGISMSILGFEIWNIRKSLEKTLEKALFEQDKIEFQMKSNKENFQKVTEDTTKKIEDLEQQGERIATIRDKALQDIEDLKKLVSIKQCRSNDKSSEGFVKFGDVGEDGKIVNTLWTRINSPIEMNVLPEMNSKLRANTCVFLRSDLPELTTNDVKLASPKRIIEKNCFVEVLESYTFQISPKNVRIWLHVKLIFPEC